jgi:uncharacterized membrane protein
MKKSSIFTAVMAAATLSAGVAHADMGNMEKCKVVKNGKGLIKEHKGDCKTAHASCSGHNKAGDPSAWIMVPKGKCAKINAGDFTGVSKEIKDKIDMH